MDELLGKPVKFYPCFLYKKEFHNTMDYDIQPVRGVIDFVHPTNGWFSVSYQAGGTTQRETFKECDIGGAVRLLGHKKDR